MQSFQVRMIFFQQHFVIKDLSLLTCFLDHSKKGVVLFQRNYVFDALHKIGTLEAKPATVPMNP